MAQINFGGVMEEVITASEFTLDTGKSCAEE